MSNFKLLIDDESRFTAYQESDAINVSSLKQIQKNPYWVIWKKETGYVEDDKKHFIVGGAIDTALTQPELYAKMFLTINQKIPGGLTKVFIDNLPPHLTMESPESDYRDAYNKSKFKIPFHSAIMRFWENKDNQEYYKLLQQARVNKQKIIGIAEQTEVINAIEGIKYSPPILGLFQVEKHIEKYTQVPLFGIVNGQQCKGCLDLLLINNKTKRIYIYDLKSTGVSVYLFPEKYEEYGYDLQECMYGLLLLQDEYIQSLLKKGYIVENFSFIATTKKDAEPFAIIFKSKRIVGDTTTAIYNKLCGLIDDYIWHVETDNWKAPRQLIDADYTIELNN